MFETLKQFCEIPAPGGREDLIHVPLAERWRPLVESVELTRVGNLVAHVGGNGKKLMLIGHGDEIGFTVKYISPDGFLFLTSGQRDDRMKPDLRGSYFTPLGQRALVLGRKAQVPGVFATLTGHILTNEQRQKTALDWNDIWVDVFMSSAEEVRAAGIEIGSRVVWNPPITQNGKLITGKAMDNRVALALMDELLRRLDRSRLAYDLYLVSTVQEEAGLIGAQSANLGLDCDYAIALDTGLSGDVPNVDPRDISTRLGYGPALIHKDLYSYSYDLNNRIVDTATEAGLPLQHAAYSLYGTDAGALIRSGVAAAALVVPARYTHSPFETVHTEDLESTLQLLLAFLYRVEPA
ncbi:MAG: M20/M25/M40 family metallo-hydrolase [Chloroflexota bacterium]|nr:MAG: aminopeptidase [Chloroflexota bacterium]